MAIGRYDGWIIEVHDQVQYNRGNRIKSQGIRCSELDTKTGKLMCSEIAERGAYGGRRYPAHQARTMGDRIDHPQGIFSFTPSIVKTRPHELIRMSNAVPEVPKTRRKSGSFTCLHLIRRRKA